MKRDDPLLAYFGHHKAASDWIHNIAKDACRTMGLNYVYIHNARQFDFDLRSFVDREKIDFLTYANADLPDVKNCLDSIRGFHVVRDPRDITVSAYFSHLHSHSADDFPRLIGHREKLRRATKEEGLGLELEFERPNFDKMSRWDYSLPNVLELKMEQLIREPTEYFCRIFNFLALLGEGESGSPRKITRNAVAEIVDRYDFAKQSGGRKPGQEDARNHYRKGVPGDWKNHFGDEHKDWFKRNYNDLLLKLGYETSANW
jgi:hypothetical protein